MFCFLQNVTSFSVDFCTFRCFLGERKSRTYKNKRRRGVATKTVQWYGEELQRSKKSAYFSCFWIAKPKATLKRKISLSIFIKLIVRLFLFCTFRCIFGGRKSRTYKNKRRRGVATKTVQRYGEELQRSKKSAYFSCFWIANPKATLKEKSHYQFSSN